MKANRRMLRQEVVRHARRHGVRAATAGAAAIADRHDNTSGEMVANVRAVCTA
jgi:hypothetical protein